MKDLVGLNKTGVTISRVIVVFEAWIRSKNCDSSTDRDLSMTSQILEIREPVLDFRTRMKRQESDNHLVSVYVLDQRVE